MSSKKKEGIMLFGVHLTAPPDNNNNNSSSTVDVSPVAVAVAEKDNKKTNTKENPNSFRKCASMDDISQCESPPHDANAGCDSDNAGYASDDVVHPPHRNTRKRGVPWSENEHRLFLLGLQNAGKGDWRGISKNFVKTRTPTQVASHAQKYFLRCHTPNRRRRRSSLFDITTDSVKVKVKQVKSRSKPVPPVPLSAKMAELQLNAKSLSLRLPGTNEPLPASFKPKKTENFGSDSDGIMRVQCM